MSRVASARYYTKAMKKFKENFKKDIEIFLKKKKSKSENMVVNNIRISQKMKNKW